MIYDCFTFFNELDLLEIRLNTLDDVVDRFVIAEATRTHTGKPKELLFEKNRERYAAFADKITYIVVDDLLSEEEIAKDTFNLPWVNENRQRNALIKGLAEARDDDVIMVSDLDEIPRPEKVQTTLGMDVLSVRFGMGNYNYFLNFKNCFYPEWKLGTILTRFSMLNHAGALDSVKPDRYTASSENAGRTVTKLRFFGADTYVKDGGWHFSYLGGVSAVMRKLSSFAHSEFSSATEEQVRQRLAQGKDVFGRGERFFAERIEDGAFPPYVIEHQHELASYLHPCDDAYLRATHWARRITLLKGALYRALVALVPSSLAPSLVIVRNTLLKAIHR